MGMGEPPCVWEGGGSGRREGERGWDEEEAGWGTWDGGWERTREEFPPSAPWTLPSLRGAFHQHGLIPGPPVGGVGGIRVMSAALVHGRILCTEGCRPGKGPSGEGERGDGKQSKRCRSAHCAVDRPGPGASETSAGNAQAAGGTAASGLETNHHRPDGPARARRSGREPQAPG